MSSTLPAITHVGWLYLFGLGLIATGVLTVLNLVQGDWLAATAMAVFCLLETACLNHVLRNRRRALP